MKATQVDKVSIYGEPDYLVVLKLLCTGRAEVIYNGPVGPRWLAAGKVGKNSQRPIALSKLRAMDKLVADGDRLAVVKRTTAGASL